MSPVLFTVGTLTLTAVLVIVVLPLVIVMHYVTKWKATQGLSDDEQRLLEDLWRDSRAMEQRVDALETILDGEVPEWRRKS